MSASDILISIAILIAVGVGIVIMRYEARRAGQTNPVGTARLQMDMTNLSARVGKIETEVRGIRSDLDGAPTKADIARLEGLIETARTIAEKTDQAVVRIEHLLMSSALPGGRPRR